MKDKPTLEDLFQSKKLDLPDENFWHGFEDRVKGKTMAALSQKRKISKVRNVGLYSFAPVLVLLFLGSHFISSELGNSPSLETASSAVSLEVLEGNELLQSIQEDLSVETEGAIQLARLDSFESFANSKMVMAGGKASFSYSELQSSGIQSTGKQFTF